ncbi:MAG: FAD-dependent oxidoreductase [Chloroflexota bacterium]
MARTPAPASARKQALVLGGGFAGVEAASALARSGRFEVTLVSDRDFLYLNPITIWIPTHGIEPERARVPLHQIAQKRGFRLVVDRVEAIRSAERRVVTAGGELAYDSLVVALGGSKLKPAGVEHTLSICGAPESAIAIRDRLDTLIARGSGSIAVGFGGNPKDRSAVRGGPAFELLFNIDHDLRRRGIRDRFSLTFFAPMAEPGERMGAPALGLMGKMLGRTGIPARTGTPIAGFDERGVAFADGSRLDADLTLFVPGVAGHPVLAASDLPLNEAGFVRIDDHGLVEGTIDVYAAGDVAALDGPEWRAKQGHTAEVMARNAAANIIAADAGRPERKGYQSHLSIMCVMDVGNGAALIYRGRKRAIAIPLPRVGHWLKQGWGAYARQTKLGRLRRLPGL